MYLRGDIDDNPHQQQCDVILLDWAAGSFSLTSLLLFSSSRWQWEHHCCIQNSDMHGHITCSYCNTHWNVLMYNDISKECHTHVSDSWYNWQKSTHSDSESELHWCTTLMSSHLIQCDVCTNRTFTLSSTRMTLVWEEWVYWVSCCWSTKRTESTSTATREEQQHMHCKEWGPCELSALRHIPVWHLHCCCCCWCCCCWACCMRVSADIFNQERFHIQKLWVKKLKKKEKRSCMWGEGFITHFTDR
jgi:hypothetical protein